MAANVVELEEKLKEAGNELLNPPSSTDDLLNLLDKLEHLLINVEQAPSRSMQDALLLPMKALISAALLRHSDADVKVSVTSCISEITRITAPDAPYNDDQMKEIFQLTVAAFEKLSHVSSRCYTKAVSILDTVAKVRSCLVMLDLELDELIIEMFQHFLKFIRSNHPHPVILAMETIMTLVIDESEDISLDLLTLLLASVRKENQSRSPMAWKLGEKVMTNSAAKLKPYLKGAVQSVGIVLDEYAPIVASLCQDESHTLDCNQVNGSGEDLVTERLSPDAACPGEVFQPVYVIPKSTERNGTATREADTANRNNSTKTLDPCSLTNNSKDTGAKNNAETEVSVEIVPDSVPRKRGRKPNSLMNPEEGYDHSWFWKGRKTAKLHHERKPHDKGPDDLPPENLVPKKEALSPTHVSVSKPMGFTPKTGQVMGTSLASPKQSVPGESHRKRGRPKRKESTMNQDADSSPLLLRKGKISEDEVKDKDAESSKKQFKEMSNSEAKQRKRPRKSVLASKTAEETSLAPGCAGPEKEAEILSEPEGKNLLKSIKGGRSTDKKRLPLKTDAKNRRLVNRASDEDFAKATGDKKTKSSSRDETYVEETSKTKLKRKHAPRKEMASETPDLGQELIGMRIKVWWPLDKRFYDGVVDSYDCTKKKHKISYADGDEETLNLKRQCWEPIKNDLLPHEGQGADGPKPDPSPDVLEMFKGKAKLESPKKPKAHSSSKRSRATSVSNMKARRSDGKSADAALRDERIVVDKLMDDTSNTDTGLKADGKCLGKLKIKSPLSGINSKQRALEIKTEGPESDVECFGINSKPASAERETSSDEESTDSGNSNPKRE